MKVLIVSQAPVPSLYLNYRSDPLAKHLAMLGHNVSVVCPKPSDKAKGQGYEKICFHYLSIQGYEKYSLVSRYRFIVSMRKSVEALLGEEKFDVVRPISLPAGYATVTAKAEKPAMVINLSDFYSDLYRQFELPFSFLISKVLRRMERRVVRGSDMLLVESPTQRTYWIDWGLDVKRCVVLPEGVNTELFNHEIDGRKVREIYGIGERPKVIFYHGDISRLDGVDILIEAAPSIVSKYEDVRFLIVGAGTEKYMQKLKALVRGKGLEGRFTFTGWVPYVQVPYYIATADLCVAPFRPTLTSNSNLPNKIEEYIAMRKPIVTTMCEGIKEMVGDVMRYVDFEEPEAVAEAVIDELESSKIEDETEMKLEKIAERLDWRNIVKHEETVMKAILELEVEDCRVFDYMLFQ